MKHYEVLFIVKPTLTEEEVNAKLEFVKGVLSKNGGEIETVVPMGTRKLAYKIKKFERGVYFVFYFKAPPSFITELERVLRISEEILRFLIVKYESKKEIAAWEKLSHGIKQSKKEIKPLDAPEIQ
ncbi:30S ribosomal protein S6 [Campylobacter sp. MIT 21-1685]|uniref:30S ribosomal protein S6 n=1 Tax=unclassified Campylobacter TaxID=2593542 RepID=UPI00224B5EB6|nr:MULTISPECIES: 30S ribosomal protein S6 [unclassified Campylobacter]MCX2683136.1 30S ribosomal protein S6 [Campylobacter sp. MIT 21-1684]MCX2751404.1 30S ribosomal protein S6 [Campylobacter sp. MIT 21-1682]MCX2807604.1 30S ribosomal protein S6 [Campylobacter sp. MIT 21-1685]